MYRSITRAKKTGVITLCAFLLFGSLESTAQKSVYDVVPGSGPKKKESPSVPGIIFGTEKKPGTVSYERRKRLPPGQAKKVYGGSARDYAYGREKKERCRDDKRKKHFKKHHKKHDHDD